MSMPPDNTDGKQKGESTMTIQYQPEDYLRVMAISMASTITDRESGKTRETTTDEESRLFPIIYGALLTINYVGRAQDAYSMIQGAKDAAEFICDITFPSCNGYDTVYCKLDHYIRENTIG